MTLESVSVQSMQYPTYIIPILATLAVASALVLIRKILQWKRSRREQRRLVQLRERYGLTVKRDRDFCGYQEYLRVGKMSLGTFETDDQTWKDLNLHAVFNRIDRTYSTPGELELYHFVRLIESSPERLAERDRVVSCLQENRCLRESIQLRLMDLGRTSHVSGVTHLIWNGDLPSTRFRRLLDVLLGVTVAALFASFAAVQQFGVPSASVMATVVILLGLNMAIHYWSRRRYEPLVFQILYLGKLVNTGRRLATIHASDLQSRLARIGRLAQHARGIPSANRFLFPERAGSLNLIDLLREYIAILLLTEVRALQRVSDEIRNCRRELQELSIEIGELDAFQSIASYRKSLDTFSRPEFCSEIRVQLEGVYHPLVQNPVANSVSIGPERQCLVTGSNMSGKSTLLRTIGVTAILAQSIATCTAMKYVAPLFHVLTSITPSDDLLGGKSFYLAEAERLLRMLEATQQPSTALCVIDEVLRGTNTTERVAAATAILRHMTNGNAIVVAATHDRELTEGLTTEFESFHFTEMVDEDGIHFDYQIRSGPAVSTNAIQILKMLGYPEEIVAEATSTAE